MKFDHMFASVPIYDGTDPDSFDDWLYQIESLCEISQRDVRVELMGRASAHVKCIIRSLPLDTDWETARRKLKRCLTEEKSRAHSAFKLAQIKQKPDENLRIFILWYQDLQAAATGKNATEDTDPTHIFKIFGHDDQHRNSEENYSKGNPRGNDFGPSLYKSYRVRSRLSVIRGSKFSKTYRSNASTRGGRGR